MKKLAFILLGAVLLMACQIAIPGRFTVPGPMTNPDNRWPSFRRYASNGERIYFTGTNAQGERIPYRGGPRFGGMMGGWSLSCASCHGENAGGGVHIMHMDVMDAPDIRYSALSGESDEHGEPGETDGHTDGHGEYDLAAFRRAVVDGKHPNGDDLKREMPRWQLNDDDLSDLFEYLKSLP